MDPHPTVSLMAARRRRRGRSFPNTHCHSAVPATKFTESSTMSAPAVELVERIRARSRGISYARARGLSAVERMSTIVDEEAPLHHQPTRQPPTGDPASGTDLNVVDHFDSPNCVQSFLDEYLGKHNTIAPPYYNRYAFRIRPSTGSVPSFPSACRDSFSSSPSSSSASPPLPQVAGSSCSALHSHLHRHELRVQCVLEPTLHSTQDQGRYPSSALCW